MAGGLTVRQFRLPDERRDALVGGAVLVLAGLLAVAVAVVAVAIVAAGARDLVFWAWGG